MGPAVPRAIKNKDTVVFSHHLLAGCPPEGIALMVDQLPGCQVHVVVTVGSPDPRAAMFPEDYDLTSVLDRWTAAVQKPQHLHLVQVDPERRDDAWHRFGDVLGIDTQDPRAADRIACPRPTPLGCAARAELLSA